MVNYRDNSFAAVGAPEELWKYQSKAPEDYVHQAAFVRIGS